MTEITRYNESKHYEMICSWWKAHKHAILDRSILPPTGVVVFDANAKPLAAGWLYITNSKAALMDWIVTAPKLAPKEAGDAVNHIIKSLENLARGLELHVVFGISGSRGLSRRMVRLGFNHGTRRAHDVLLKELTHGT